MWACELPSSTSGLEHTIAICVYLGASADVAKTAVSAVTSLEAAFPPAASFVLKAESTSSRVHGYTGTAWTSSRVPGSTKTASSSDDAET